MIAWLAHVLAATGRDHGAVFVPAVMGAGVVLSIATLLRDLATQGRRELAERRAVVRAPVLVDWVERGPNARPWRVVRPASRRAFIVTGAAAVSFGMYVAIGTTGNFLRPAGYVHDIAWMWGASLAVSALGSGFGVACILVGALGERAPSAAWDVVAQTPLVGRGPVGEHRLSQHAVVIGSTIATALMILATWPHVLDPLDRRVGEAIDRAPTDEVEVIGETLGSTPLTLTLAVLVGLGTLRCRRFATIFVVGSVATLAATLAVRSVVSRPRPLDGARAGDLDSFPSGHMVQATLLAVLLPLAVHELTRSKRWRDVSRVVLVAGLGMVAFVSVSTGRHHATDVLAGGAIGLAAGSWGRLALHRSGSHRRCRRCRFSSERP